MHGCTESPQGHTFHQVVIGPLPRGPGRAVAPRARPTRLTGCAPANSCHCDCRGGLAGQLHLDLLASVKLLTEFTTLAALVATAATWVAEGLDGSALTAVWSASTDVLTAVV